MSSATGSGRPCYLSATPGPYELQRTGREVV